MYERFTDRARKVMQLANQEAQRFNHEYIGTEHILLGLVKEGSGVAANVLKNLDIDLRKIRLEVEKIVQHGPGGEQVVMGRLPHTPRAKKVIEYSIEEARNLNHNYVGTEHLLLGLLREQEGVAAQVLMNLGLKLEDVREEVLNLLGHNMPNESESGREGGGDRGSSERTGRSKSKTPALDSFGRDLTELARQGKLDPVIGRQAEIERVIQILSRRQKNNPVLLGEAGVGKTAIVEGLAQLVVDQNVPEILRDKRIVVLDLAMMVAGTKYRGQFEERIKAVMNEVRRAKNTMLFIDELHTLVGAGGAEGAIDASNVLKPALARGEIQCIGATTLDEYRKYIEKDAALARRFQAIIVNPPSMAETVEILKGLRDRYEAHHRVQIKDEALKAAVELSERYITGHCLPDKAIDVIDEAGARVRLKGMTRPPDLKELDEKIEKLNQEKEAAVMDQDFERAAHLRDQSEKLRKEKETTHKQWREKAKETDGVVDEEVIAEVVSKMTGVPLKKVGEDETKRLLNMEAELHNTVISQNEAIHAIAKAVRKSRSGMKDPKRPIGTFIFAGPTGVGKTLLAKQLAKFMFGDENNIVQLDMSEYMEKHNVSRLVGAPPGYIGYEEGGQLTEKIRRKPYSVVLLDEIEKAHPDVWNMLLQIMEEGRLTDNVGRTVDFKNTILIMTTNIGAETIVAQDDMGSVYTRNIKKDTETTYQDMQKKLRGRMEKEFRPEFLNRLDEIIVFRQLEKFDLKEIVDMELAKVQKRLKEKGLTLNLPDPPAIQPLALAEWTKKKGFDFVAVGAGTPVEAVEVEIPADARTTERWLRDNESDLKLEHSPTALTTIVGELGDMPTDYREAKVWLADRMRESAPEATLRVEKLPVHVGTAKEWLSGRRAKFEAAVGELLDDANKPLTYGRLVEWFEQRGVRLDFSLTPVDRRLWRAWFKDRGVDVDGKDLASVFTQLPPTWEAALREVKSRSELKAALLDGVTQRDAELPLGRTGVKPWLLQKAKKLDSNARDFPQELHPAKEYLIGKGANTEYGARPLRRAIEQHLEDMLAEEILKGTFQGADTINVKVIEENGEKKLGFDANIPAPAVVGQ